MWLSTAAGDREDRHEENTTGNYGYGLKQNCKMYILDGFYDMA